MSLGQGYALMPSATERLDFLNKVQQLLMDGQFTTSYKFALLISLTRLAIEKGRDDGAALFLSYVDIAEKFIELYWQQSLPYGGANASTTQPLSPLHQNSNEAKPAKVITLIQDARTKAGVVTLAALRRSGVWEPLVKDVAKVVKLYPTPRLQLINKTKAVFLYDETDLTKGVTLLPGVMFCLRQFGAFIEELAKNRWVSFVRQLNANKLALGNLPDVETYLFESTRQSLDKIREFLWDLQKGTCFYTGARLSKPKDGAVDHFIPWSMYPVDWGHNFVLASPKANSKKSNFLAGLSFYQRWATRNATHDDDITNVMRDAGFLVDMDTSMRIASWAYHTAASSSWLVWDGSDSMTPLNSQDLPFYFGNQSSPQLTSFAS